MKVETHNDPWGGIILELRGENSHENTLLELLNNKRMAEQSIGELESTNYPSSKVLTFTFRERESIKADGPKTACEVSQ